MSVAIVTGAIAPYTHRLFEAVGQRLSVPLHVITCTRLEPHRQWQVGEATHYHRQELSGMSWHRSYHSHVYFNPAVITALRQCSPTVVGFSGFSPTMMAAGLYAKASGKRLAVMTDGRRDMDPGARSWVHRLMRNIIVPRGDVSICASQESAELLAAYGLGRERAAVVPITTPWAPPTLITPLEERTFDLMFCGALVDDPKGALFFARVASKLQERLGTRRLRVRVVGDGADRRQMEAMLAEAGIDAQFDGYLTGAALRAAYGSARLFAFPSRGDPWGLVANEAIACGTPVIGSPHATSSDELVAPFAAGDVQPLIDSNWVQALERGLTDDALWALWHSRCASAARTFTVDVAARKLTDAFDNLLMGRSVRSDASPDRLQSNPIEAA